MTALRDSIGAVAADNLPTGAAEAPPTTRGSVFSGLFKRRPSASDTRKAATGLLFPSFMTDEGEVDSPLPSERRDAVMAVALGRGAAAVKPMA